jgi:quercetin dioxygenase-like cupin family protein
MKRTLVGTRALVLCLAAVVAAGTAAAAKAKSAKAKPALVTKTPDELKWVPNPAAPDSISMAAVSGDPDKGAHAAFHKFKAGFAVPLHTHSSDIRFAVISGTMNVAPEGGPEKKLPPGSYVFQPHGVKHTTKCEAGSDCVIFTTASGKFDVIPAEAKK